MKLEDQLRKNG